MALLGDLLPKELYTERLKLERFEYTDEQFDGLLEWTNSPQALELQGDFGVKSAADMMSFEAPFRLRDPRLKDGIAERDLAYYIRLPSDGKLIGCVSLAHRRAGSQELPPDMGWVLAQPYFGHGYAFEAAKEVLRFLREDLGLKDISALVNERNAPSNRLAAKLGFEGGNQFYLKDEEKWAPLWVLPHMGKLNITEPVYFKGEADKWAKENPGDWESRIAALRKLSKPEE